MKLKKLRITRAKRTAMGRFVCRLWGDECGAVAMEYVVIALLIVAAAVGAAVFFGRGIAAGLTETTTVVIGSGTIEKKTEKARTNLNTVNTQGRKTNKDVQKQMIDTNNPE